MPRGLIDDETVKVFQQQLQARDEAIARERRDNWMRDAEVQNKARPAWWDLAKMIKIGGEIAREEGAKQAHKPGEHNGLPDAYRHAEWMRRTATNAGPVFAATAGIGHEVLGFNPPAEIAMDLRNDQEGLRAAQERRQVNPGNLQREPITPELRDALSPNRRTYPSRPAGYPSPGAATDQDYGRSSRPKR